jgi:hypothetical protein
VLTKRDAELRQAHLVTRHHDGRPTRATDGPRGAFCGRLFSITRLDDSGQRGSVCHGNSEVTDASQHTAYAPDRRARSRALGAAASRP